MALQIRTSLFHFKKANTNSGCSDCAVNWGTLRFASAQHASSVHPLLPQSSFFSLSFFLLAQVNSLCTPDALRSFKCAFWDPAIRARPIKHALLCGAGPRASSVRVRFTRRSTSSSRMTASAAVMSCTESLVPSPNIPFRRKVFIFLHAAYECLSPKEGLAALQPVITSNRFFFPFLFTPSTPNNTTTAAAEVPRRNTWHGRPSHRH